MIPILLLLCSGLGHSENVHDKTLEGHGFRVQKLGSAHVHGDSSSKKIWDNVILKGIATYPEIKCPIDFEEIAGSCYHVKQTLPDTTCSKDATLTMDNMCLVRTASKAGQTCPDFYELVDKVCKRKEIVAPVPECEKGELVNGECISDSKASPITMCMKGSSFRDGDCIMSEEYKPNAICDVDYFLKGKDCVKLTYYNSFFGCFEKDTVLEGDHCVSTRTKPLSYYCPKGYKLSDDKQCWAKIYQTPLVSCIKGDLESDVCIVKKKGETLKKCKIGYVYDEINDTCYSYEAPEEYCPKGFVYTHGDCYEVTKKPALKVCPQGTVFEGKKCVAIDTRPADYRCPEKYTFDQGECVFDVVKAATTMCPKGTLLKADGQCVQEESTKATPECDVGIFDEKSKKCIVEVKSPPIVECPHKYRLEADGNCLKYSSIEPALMCPKLFKLDIEGCTRVFSSKSSFECPAGEVAAGKECIREVEVPPTLQCRKDAIFAHGFCNQAIVQKAVKICPKDRKLDSKDGMCHLLKKNISPKVEAKIAHKEEKKDDVHDYKGDKLQKKKEIELKDAIEKAVKKAEKESLKSGEATKLSHEKKGGEPKLKVDHKSNKAYVKVYTGDKEKEAAIKLAKTKGEKSPKKGQKITQKLKLKDETKTAKKKNNEMSHVDMEE